MSETTEKMKYTALVFTLLLSGCDFNVYHYEVAGYIRNCEEHNGLAKIDNVSRSALCNDGERVGWRRDDE